MPVSMIKKSVTLNELMNDEDLRRAARPYAVYKARQPRRHRCPECNTELQPKADGMTCESCGHSQPFKRGKHDGA